MAEQDAGPAVPFTRDFFEHEDGIEWTVSRVLGGVLASSPRVDVSPCNGFVCLPRVNFAVDAFVLARVCN